MMSFYHDGGNLCSPCPPPTARGGGGDWPPPTVPPPTSSTLDLFTVLLTTISINPSFILLLWEIFALITLQEISLHQQQETGSQ